LSKPYGIDFISEQKDVLNKKIPRHSFRESHLGLQKKRRVKSALNTYLELCIEFDRRDYWEYFQMSRENRKERSMDILCHNGFR